MMLNVDDLKRYRMLMEGWLAMMRLDRVVLLEDFFHGGVYYQVMFLSYLDVHDDFLRSSNISKNVPDDVVYNEMLRITTESAHIGDSLRYSKKTKDGCDD